MYENGLRNVIHDPHKYAFNLERHKETKRYRQLARSVLASLEETNSVHFSRGFEDGFVHFMEYGQFGGEPAVPPREYWGVKFQSSPGRAAVEQWFTGFAFGEEIAASGHYRDMVTVPGFAPFAGPRHQPAIKIPYDEVHDYGEVEYVEPPNPEGAPPPVVHLESG